MCGPLLIGILATPLRADRLADCDFEIVRELAGDIYFGKHGTQGEGSTKFASDEATYSVAEIERVSRYAFERALARNRRVTSVDKANIWRPPLFGAKPSRSWRRGSIPASLSDHLYVDNAAMIADRAAPRNNST